jgi:hypothetical protein
MVLIPGPTSCTFFPSYTQPASCTNLFTVWDYWSLAALNTSASSIITVTTFGRFWHTTITTDITTILASDSTYIQTSSATAVSNTFNAEEASCMPGPTNCEFTYAAASCPDGYQGVTTLGVTGLTFLTCCPDYL